MQGIVLIMEHNFTLSRVKLIVLYLLIIASVIVIFSSLIVYQARDSFSGLSVPTDKDVIVKVVDAKTIAQNLVPDSPITNTEYEVENSILYLTVSFANDTDVKVNALSGKAFIPSKDSGLIAFVTNSFEKRVGWMAFGVFCLAGLLSVFVANFTLTPITRAIRAQKQFVSDSGHELRNPLAAMHARIESELMTQKNNSSQKVLEDLLSETKRLIALSEGLLTLEKAEHRIKNTPAIPVAPIIHATLERLGSIAEAKQITLSTDICPETLAITSIDLETILYNLVHNALKFSDTGSEIMLTWKQATLRVVDTGKGIPEKDLTYIFDRFYKTDTARTYDGNGLGLALVKTIVDKYHAAISVQSTVGKGSTFTIRFTS